MSLKRFYAFEAAGISPAVRNALENAERNVDARCTSAIECDRVLSNIDTMIGKFNAALETMLSAAQSYKNGAISAEDMAARINPAQIELKEVARSIGVATEADGVSEDELKDSKDYLEGAKEIAETKKDEVKGDDGDGEKKDDDKKDDDDGEKKGDGKKDDDDGECDGECDEKEDKAAEAWLANPDLNFTPATEGQNIEAYKQLITSNGKAARKLRSEAMKMAKAGDTDGAIAKLEEAKAKFAEAKNAMTNLPKDAVGTTISWLISGWLQIIYSFVGEGGWKEAPNKNVSVAMVINYTNRAMAAIDKKIAALKAQKGNGGEATKTEGASESFTVDEIAAMESEAASCFVAMESYFDPALEGYNYDKRADYKANMESAKNKIKEAKAAAKSGDVAKVKSIMESAISDMEKAKADFDNACKEQGTASSSIIGYFAYGWRGFGLMMLAALATLPLGGIGSWVVAIKHNVEFWADIIQAIKKVSDGEELSASDFNMYTKSMSHNMSLMIGQMKEISKKLVAKAEKKSGGAAQGSGEATATATESFINACNSLKIGDSGSFLFE